MILVDLPPGTPLFRARTPQWAIRPTSGAGAALRGGRFNREGVEALYLSLDEVTALREYPQTSAALHPLLTIVVLALFDYWHGVPWVKRQAGGGPALIAYHGVRQQSGK